MAATANSAKPVKSGKKRLMTGLFLLMIFCIGVGISVITPIFATLSSKILISYSLLTIPEPNNNPEHLVVLGGGLTRDKSNRIILNHYSRSRADAVIVLENQQPRQIITSGVESPWLQDYLKSKLNNAVIISENASMNTCENAIFTAKLIEHYNISPNVILVTDRYHIARARRQFAKAGVQTIARIAPLAVERDWLAPKQNLVHSRRAVYEIGALLRDIFSPQQDCRNSNQITIDEISTPRRKPKIFT